MNLEHYQKTKMKVKTLVLAFVEGAMLVPIKTELSSFNILERVRFGILKMFFWGESLKILHEKLYDILQRY